MPKQWYIYRGRRVLTLDALRECNKFLVSLRFTRSQRLFVLETWSAPDDLDEVLPPREKPKQPDELTRIAQEPLKEPSQW